MKNCMVVKITVLMVLKRLKLLIYSFCISVSVNFLMINLQYYKNTLTVVVP